MRKPFVSLMAAALFLASCGAVQDSRINPVNWFGKSREVAKAPSDEEVNPLLPKGNNMLSLRKKEHPYAGVDVARITDVTLDPVANGGVLRVQGLARIDAYNLRLVPRDSTRSDTLAFALQAEFGPDRATSSRATRTVIAARHVTADALEGIRRIRVEGVENARDIRK